MQKIIDYLYRLKQANDEMGNYEAIEDLESLQNRKCENCKFSYRLRNTIYDCDIIKKLDLPKDFYCKYWEPKNEKI